MGPEQVLALSSRKDLERLHRKEAYTVEWAFEVICAHRELKWFSKYTNILIWTLADL